MNYIDIAIAIPLLWGTYKGFTKGLVIELASIIGLILGVYVGMHYSDITAGYISQFVEIEQTFLPIVSFAATFISVILVVLLLAKILEKLVNLVALKLVNKISGAGFGLLKATFIVSLIIVFVESVDSRLELIPKETKEGSLLYQTLGSVAPTIIPAIKDLDVLKEAVEQTEDVEITL